MKKILISIISILLVCITLPAQQPLEKQQFDKTKSAIKMPPDPLDKKMISTIRTQMQSLGFTVGTIKKTKNNKWRVSTTGWNKSRASQSNKGLISAINKRTSAQGRCQLEDMCSKGKTSIKDDRSWDPTDAAKNKGIGSMLIEVDEDGLIMLRQYDLNLMGLRTSKTKIKLYK